MKKNKYRLVIYCLIGITISLFVGFVSSKITRQAIPNWYANLNKPFFSPPNWIFAPVWTTLYILMGIALGRVWFYGRHNQNKRIAVLYFAFQLLVNGLWSLIFFGFKMPSLSMIVIIILWFLIQRSIFWFRLIDLKASFMLYPYLAWVSFAAILNGAIIFLN